MTVDFLQVQERGGNGLWDEYHPLAAGCQVQRLGGGGGGRGQKVGISSLRLACI